MLENHPFIWVNYNISLTWILRPFEDDFPKISHASRLRENCEVVIIYPDNLDCSIVFWGSSSSPWWQRVARNAEVATNEAEPLPKKSCRLEINPWTKDSLGNFTHCLSIDSLTNESFKKGKSSMGQVFQHAMFDYCRVYQHFPCTTLIGFHGDRMRINPVVMNSTYSYGNCPFSSMIYLLKLVIF